MVQAPGLLHAAEIPPCEASVLYHQPACEVKRPLLAQTGSPAPRAGIGTTDMYGIRGSAKMNVIWAENFSSYLEVHGTATSQQQQANFANLATSSLQTIGVQAGLRYTWN